MFSLLLFFVVIVVSGSNCGAALMFQEARCVQNVGVVVVVVLLTHSCGGTVSGASSTTYLCRCHGSYKDQVGGSNPDCLAAVDEVMRQR